MNHRPTAWWAWRPKAVQPPTGQGSAVGAKVRRVVTIRPVNSRRGSLGGYGRRQAQNQSLNGPPPSQPTSEQKTSRSGVGTILLHKQSLKTKTSVRQNSKLIEQEAGSGWDRMESFLETILAVSSEIRPEEAAEKVIEECCKLLQCDRTTLFFVDAEANELILVVARGANNIRLPMGSGIAGTVALTGITANIKDAYKDSRFDPSFDRDTGYKTKSIVASVVRDASGGIVAVLQCINKLPSGSFSLADQYLLEKLASHVGSVLETAKVFETEHTAKAKVDAMLEIIGMVHSNSTSAHSLIFALSNRCHDLVDGDRCTLYLVDQTRKELAVMQGDVDIRFPMTQGLAGHVATSQQHLIIDDAYENPKFNKAIDLKTGYRTKAMLVMPVFGDDKEGIRAVVGVLQIINKIDDTEVFSQADHDILSTILAITGPILERSQIFENQKKRNKLEINEGVNGMKGGFTSPSRPRALSNEQKIAFAEEEEEEDDF